MRTRALNVGLAVWSAGVCLLCALPLVPLVGMADVAVSVRAGCVMLALVAAARPAAAVLLLPALLSLSLAVEILGAGIAAADLSECLMFAVVAGAATRWWRAEGRAPTRLGRPALVLAAAVVAVLIVELFRLQAIAPGRPLAAEVWTHVSRDYWRGVRPFGFVHEAMRWLGCLGLAVVVERAIRDAPRHAAAAVRIWVVAGGVAGAYAAWRLVEVVGRRAEPLVDTLRWVATNYRIAAFSPDPNATGSYFAIFLTALLLLVLQRGVRVWALAALPTVLLAFALAQSRAAIGVVVATLAVVAFWRVPARRRVAVGVGAGVVGALLIVGGLVVTARSHAPIGAALELRKEMTLVAGRMMARYPMWGVGLGNYARVSRRFMSDDQTALLTFAPSGENAHNNFLQVIVELGLPAGAAFLWLVLPVAWAGLAPRGVPDVAGRDALAAGASALLLTALFGHPLLIPQVAMAFFLTLGLAASGVRLPTRDDAYARWAMWAGVALFTASLLWRIR